MAYMVAGYLIIWAASFVFILSMVRRQGKLQQDINALTEALREKK